MEEHTLLDDFHDMDMLDQHHHHHRNLEFTAGLQVNIEFILLLNVTILLTF